MNRNKLASRIAKIEGKKHQATIGDIREILSILHDLMQEDDEILIFMLNDINDIISERSVE